MFERFNDQARAVVVRAKAEARHLHHDYIGTEHLLLALLDDQAGIAYAVLTQGGINRDQVRADVQRLLGAPAAILGEEDAAALRTVGIDLDAVLARIKESFGEDALSRPRPPSRRGLLHRKRTARSNNTPFTSRAKKVLELSLREALHLRDRYIGAEHILLGILREGDGLAARVLADGNIHLDHLRRQVLTQLGKAA